MIDPIVARAFRVSALLATVLSALVPTAHAADGPRSWLVNCGARTCLRIAGDRAARSDVVSVAGAVLPVEGGRAWRVTVPLDQARGWRPDPSGLAVTIAGAGGARHRTETVPLPPGALGRRVELISMVVGAR